MHRAHTSHVNDDDATPDDIVYGPFDDETKACHWATRNLGYAGHWYWLPLTPAPHRTIIGPSLSFGRGWAQNFVPAEAADGSQILRAKFERYVFSLCFPGP